MGDESIEPDDIMKSHGRDLYEHIRRWKELELCRYVYQKQAAQLHHERRCLASNIASCASSFLYVAMCSMS